MPAVRVRFKGLESYKTWQTVRDGVKRSPWYRSDPLSAVNKAVKSYCESRTMPRRLAVDDAIYRIRLHSKSTYERYRVAMDWLIGQLQNLTPHKPGIDRCAHFGPNVGQMLNSMCHFAVTDLKSFPGSIRAGHVGRLWNRYGQMTDAELGQESKAGKGVRVKFDRQSMGNASRLVAAGRSGCCTTFAARGASILLENGCTSRVEVVAVPTKGRVAHCFVLVGRVGNAIQGTIPKDLINTWGPDWCVVDPWLAALGFNCIYPLGQNFPNKWLRGSFSDQQNSAGLEQKFDSRAVAATAADVRLDIRRNLKTTGIDVTK